MAMKVYKLLGANAVEEIKKNPYILSDQIDGIKFSVADRIAYGEGFAINSPIRIQSGLKYILVQAAYSSGHVYLPKSIMIEHGAYQLKVSEKAIW